MQALLWSKTAAPELTEHGLRKFFADALGPKTIQMKRATWISIYHPQSRLLDHFRVGKVFLAGDAAHVHPPSGGQGMNTGVQDAYNLGWKLAHVLHGGNAALLDTYELERLPIAKSVLNLSTRLLKDKSIKRGKETQQLDLHYRDSPLSQEFGTSTNAGLKAGDRASDALCRDYKGQVCRLFDIYRGTHATLLVFGNHLIEIMKEAQLRWAPNLRVVRMVSKDAQSVDDLEDPDGKAHKNYVGEAGSSACVVVRPDGYIGLVSTKLSISELENYVEQILGIQPQV